jgi:hypothetical protein
MKFVIILLSLGAAISAFAAAHYWYRSAQVKTPDFGQLGAYSPSREQTESFNSWVGETATLSRHAARWVAVSAVLNGAIVLV